MVVSIVLYLVFVSMVEQVMLRKYEKVFAEAQHPQDTILIDSLRFKFSYYPATYIDESIGFKAAYVISELRAYTDKWADVEGFYQSHNRLPGDKMMIAIPLEIQQGKERTYLNEVDGFSISPFDAQLLIEIQDKYGSLKNTNGTERNLYLVYVSWAEHKDPGR
jgi:hypothetical protein